MKIVEVISDTNIGGAGVLLLTRLLSDKNMCNNTTVIVPTGSLLSIKFRENRINYIEVDACIDRSFEFTAIFKYFFLIKKLSPDIINCHGCLSFRIAAFLCKVPVRIYTRHCTFPLARWQRSTIFKVLIGKCQTLLSNGIIAVADVVKKDLVDMGVPSHKINVIINGVRGIQRLSNEERKEIRRRLKIPECATVVSIFARIEEYKGHIDLINAGEILLKSSDNYRFLIVGEGSRLTELKRLCKDKGLEQHFIFTGFQSDVTEYFNITDINVNCSHGTETSSLALSEGMSLGIPCIASNYGGNCYMVQSGVNGFIYPCHDYKLLSTHISNIANDKELYRRLSKNAYSRYERELNSKKMTEATYNYYTQLR